MIRAAPLYDVLTRGLLGVELSKELVFSRLGIPSKSKIGNTRKPLMQLSPSALGL